MSTKKRVSQPGGDLAMCDAPETLHASVRATDINVILPAVGLYSSETDDMYHLDRCTPSADVLQRIYTFSSNMASDVSGSEQSLATRLALRALAYVQTLACRLSGGDGKALGRRVCHTMS